MSILKKAVNEQAYLKAGLLGFPGTGKTFTASMLAIGISKRVGDKKPVAFFDTETGSDFLIPRFEAEGVELLRVKSQAFTDLLAAGREAENTCSCLIVDSITHVWRELGEAYQKRRKISKLQFQHWADLKREWAEWTTFYLNSRIHIIVCGRAGFEYEQQTDDDGKKEIVKVGTKMKTESEFGFEPSLLVEMERAGKSAKPGAGWVHRAHVLKDRTDTINGAAFDFQRIKKVYKVGDWQQTFKPFQPIFDALNIGGEHVGLDASRTSESRFSGRDGESEGQQWAKRRTIALEEIQGSLVAVWPGQDAASKKSKSLLLEALFQTRSWTAVEGKRVEELEASVKILHAFEEYIKTAPESISSEEGLLATLATCRDALLGPDMSDDDIPDFEAQNHNQAHKGDAQ